MVKLMFTALPPENAARTFSVTVGASHTAWLWNNRQSFEWEAFCALFREAQIGVKQGTCFVPATFNGTQRRREQANKIDLIVLDSDCGHTFDEISRAVESHGWRAIIHSTHSHLNDTTMVSAKALDAWKLENPNCFISDYMGSKKGYLPRVTSGAEIIDEGMDGASRVYIIKHQPCEKYRVILPLSAPWEAVNYENVQVAQAVWHERIGALGRALGLTNDMSCSDVSRLFFFPRRKEGQEYKFRVIDGDDCDLWTLPDSGAVVASAENPAQKTLFSTVKNEHKIFRALDGKWIDLTQWAASTASRFQIVDAIKAKCPQIIGRRRSSVKVHITCPNNHRHVTGETDQTGTYAVNASDIKASGLSSCNGFTIHCMHGGCAGIDRLDHIHAMLEAGLLSIEDLTTHVVNDVPMVDISALIEPKAETGNISPRILNDLPGIMGVIHDYMVRTSTKPQPALCLASTLAFMASCLGQRVMVQGWKTRPNIYCIGICYTGAGKERPLSAAKALAIAAGLYEELIGVEGIASDSGIINAVIQKPRAMMLIDEVADILSAVNSRNAGPHLAGVITTLLKLYSSSHTRFSSKSYADLTKTKHVDEPCMSFCGITTPEGFAGSLTSKDITSGLLSRIVVFDGGDHDPKGKPSEDMEPPQEALDWIKAWHTTRPAGEHYLLYNGMPHIPKYSVPMTDDAKQIIDRFDDEMRAAKIKAREHNTDSLYVRAVENALKFALVRACSAFAVNREGIVDIDPTTLSINADCANWAVSLSRATVQTMETVARESVADSAFEAKRKRLKEMVMKAGKHGATRRDIARHAAGRMPERELNDVLASLTTAGDIVFVSIKTGGRPREAFLHRKYAPEDSAD